MQPNRGKLMWASFLTLIAAGMGFAVRGGVLAEWGADFGFTQFELGTITGMGFAGFGVVIIFASLITDRVGYRAILAAALILHVLSLIITLAATPAFSVLGKDAAYWCLYVGVFVFAVANGLCETAINPLIANIYPEKKTHYLNILHAGWPAGLVIGGLLGQVLVGTVRWEIPLALYGIPTIWYGIIILREAFPDSDVKKAGISFGQMLAEFASPVLLVLLVLHAGVGYVELGTDSWITNITNSLLTGQGFMLFVYASSLMFILRFFAGPIVEKINPLGLLCVSTVLGTTGLLLLGYVRGAVLIWIAVTIYGFGKTFLWPTMLGIVGERFPRGGAITMGAIGGAGALSAGFLGGPLIGYKQDVNATAYLKKEDHQATYDRYKSGQENKVLFGTLPSIQGLDGQKVGTLLDGGKKLDADFKKFSDNEKVKEHHTWWTDTGKPNETTDKTPIADARIYGGQRALTLTAIVPACMFVGYLLLVLYFKSQGGYKEIDLKDDDKPKNDEES